MIDPVSARYAAMRRATAAFRAGALSFDNHHDSRKPSPSRVVAA
jgi:hypothetical protein